MKSGEEYYCLFDTEMSTYPVRTKSFVYRCETQAYQVWATSMTFICKKKSHTEYVRKFRVLMS